MVIKTIKAQSARISYPALLLTQNKHRFFFLTIPVDDLFPSCFVSRREEEPVQGFQRALNESRADDIAKYLADGSGSIPSNIVLSAQEIAGFKYDPRTKSVSFGRAKAAFLVLDGQHRLWGYQKCGVRHRVPIAVYDGLSRAEEAKLFIDINTTQRGVPAALLLDIKNLAQIELDMDATLRALFDRLSTDHESPLIGRLSPARSIVGKISRVTFNRAVAPVLTGTVMMGTPPESRYKLIKNYLNAFDAELADKKLLVRSSFFEALFSMFDSIIQTTVATSRNAKQATIQNIVQPLARLDYRLSGSDGILDKKGIISLMRSTLHTSTPISNEML
jgi:DNA sulfur modification protein DndB